MSISAHTRREAILLLDVAASQPDLGIEDCRLHLDLSGPRRRYSQAERDEAILICAIAASTPVMGSVYRTVCWHLGVDINSPSSVLALRAWAEIVAVGVDSNESAIVDAEAEALLQCGWSPGDEP